MGNGIPLPFRFFTVRSVWQTPLAASLTRTSFGPGSSHEDVGEDGILSGVFEQDRFRFEGRHTPLV